MATTISLSFDKYQAKDISSALTNHYGKKRMVSNHSNSKIDVTRSWRNITFQEPGSSLRERALARIAEEKERNPKLRVKSDSNVMVGVTVNIGGDIRDEPVEKHVEFLQEAYKYIVDRFGGEDAENILCAEIHMDETAPHLHVNFVPIFNDKERSRLTVQPIFGGKQKLSNEHVVIRDHMNEIANGRWLCEAKYEDEPESMPAEEYKKFMDLVDRKVDEKVLEVTHELRDRAIKLVGREKVAETMLADADKAAEEARLRQAWMAEQAERLNAYGNALLKKEEELKEKEEELKERETLLELAQRALHDLASSVNEFGHRFVKSLRGALNRTREDEVLAKGVEFTEKVVEPTREVTAQPVLDPATLIDDLEQPIIDANDLISDLKVYQPSALER